MADTPAHKLLAAIDALVVLVKKNEGTSESFKFPNEPDRQLLDDLDALVYALATHLGLLIPKVSEASNAPSRLYGHTGIPSMNLAPGRVFFATAEWQQAMAGLRASAEVLAAELDVSQLETTPDPMGFYIPPADLLTTAELAALAGVGTDRFHNVLSEERKAGASDLPIAVEKGSGTHHDQFSYQQARPFLVRKWPQRDAAGYFPPTVAEAKKILAAQK